ncbi:MAG: mandelate racemase/muconate lactonizing enzyme family protein [Ilumatobacteraceae bacterium]|jgi:D-galactarolactone cycloisomerase
MTVIDRVECIHLRFEMPKDRTFSTPGGPVHGRLTTLIRLTTDDGLTGIGSAYAHPALVQATVDHLRPFILGYDPRETERHWNRLHGISRWYGRKGAAVTAIGGIDQAIWDLHGKMVGRPVWDLLGGSSPRVAAYASGMLYSSPESVAEDARAAVARGFTRVKMRAGWNWDYDVAAVLAVREAIGPDRDLMVDGTWRFTLPAALDFAELLEEQGVFWFEEPLASDELDDFVALRAATSVPLACGENEFAIHGFREWIRVGAVDIVQADASRAGGITEVIKIAREAEVAGLRFAPHSWCDAVAVVANAHAVAASPNGITVEIDQTGNRFIEELLGGPLSVVDGFIDLGRRPGLGIELDEAAVDDMRLVDPSAIPDGNYCDVVYGRGQTRYIGDYVGRRH